MMTNVHLAGDGDMYSGFGREDVAPALDTADLEFDSGFQVRIFYWPGQSAYVRG